MGVINLRFLYICAVALILIILSGFVNGIFPLLSEIPAMYLVIAVILLGLLTLMTSDSLRSSFSGGAVDPRFMARPRFTFFTRWVFGAVLIIMGVMTVWDSSGNSPFPLFSLYQLPGQILLGLIVLVDLFMIPQRANN